MAIAYWQITRSWLDYVNQKAAALPQQYLPTCNLVLSLTANFLTSPLRI
nr:hypothetical protein [Pyrobaculum sp.]